MVTISQIHGSSRETSAVVDHLTIMENHHTMTLIIATAEVAMITEETEGVAEEIIRDEVAVDISTSQLIAVTIMYLKNQKGLDTKVSHSSNI